MLALTRKKGESIIIGDNIEVVVIGIQNDQVKLGIVAPKEISIHRKEIYERIQEENKQASIKTDINISQLRGLFKNEQKKNE
jgi:carbon storage regulator